MTIRFGTENDIGQIINIQDYWLEQKSKNSNRFLFGTPYSYEDLAELSLRKQIAVATEFNKVRGYFIFDNHSNNDTTNMYKDYLVKLTTGRVIDYPIENICPRAQIAVDKSFLGNNLSRRLTEFLFAKSGHKFDAVFSVVSKQNINIETHVKNGWKIVEENDELYFVLLGNEN